MIEMIFEWGINLIESFILIDFITRYLGCKYEGNTKTISFIGAWLLLFGEICFINYVTVFEGIGAFIQIAIYLVYAFLFLRESILLKVWISILTEIILMIVAIGSNLMICALIDYNPNEMITVFNATRIVGVIISKIILFYITRLILKRRYKNPMDKKAWIMLILIPVISVFSLSSLMIAAMNNDEIVGYVLGGMAGIIIANIITYYLFTMMNKDYEDKLKINLLEMQNENAKKNIENMDAFVTKMRMTRHDMKNQLLIIDNYIDKENYTDAHNYIKNLINEYLPSFQSFSSTGNIAFDAILNSKIALCNQKNIYIEVKVKQDSIKKVDQIDTGILFGNLIDNAIEATENAKDKRITVDVREQGMYLSILISNSIEKSVLNDNSSLKTSKQDTELHGLGIRSVKEIIKKYDGMIQFFEENNEFNCHILLDVNKR